MEHKAQLENIKYRNWVRAGLGIKYLKEGLEPFCDHLVNQQHVAILDEVKRKHKLSTVSCGLCVVRTLQPDHVQTKTRTCPLGQMYCNCQHTGGKMSCPNRVCGAIYDEIIQLHASTPPAPNWKITDAQQWCTEPWAVAKCFINAPGYETKKSRAAEFDCPGLLHVLINNIEFRQHIKCVITGTDAFSRVRKSRNDIFHSHSMELEDTEVNNYIDDMIELLEDEHEIKHRQESKDAVKNLLELKRDDFIITTTDEAEIRRVAIAAINEKERELEQTIRVAGNKFRTAAAEGKRMLEQEGQAIKANLQQTGEQKRIEIENQLTAKTVEAEQNIELKLQESKLELESVKNLTEDLIAGKSQTRQEAENSKAKTELPYLKMSDCEEEAAYYLRLMSMYIELGTEVVLKVFIHHIPGNDAESFLLSNTSKLQQLKNDKILNKQESDLVLTSTPNPKAFDVSLLITLSINLFSEQQLPSPKTGWSNPPRNSDKSVSADLLRLRVSRNLIVGHCAKALLPQWIFEKEWTNLEEIFLRIYRNIAPGEESHLKQRIEDYRLRKLGPSTENKYSSKLHEWQQEISEIQQQVEDAVKTAQGIGIYVKRKSDIYERYIKLLVKGGRFVILALIEDNLKTQNRNIRDILNDKEDFVRKTIDNRDHLNILYPPDRGSASTPIDMSTWDITLLSTVLIQVLDSSSLDNKVKRAINCINTARENYAGAAVALLDSDVFEEKYSYPLNSIYFLSQYLDRQKKIECEEIVYECKSILKSADTHSAYFDELQNQSMNIKSIGEIYKDTVQKLKYLLQKMNTNGISFRSNHDLDLKMITLGSNEEKRQLALNMLTAFWHEALDRSSVSTDSSLVTEEVTKILKEITKPRGITGVALKQQDEECRKKHCNKIAITVTTPVTRDTIATYFKAISSKLSEHLGGKVEIQVSHEIESLYYLPDETDSGYASSVSEDTEDVTEPEYDSGRKTSYYKTTSELKPFDSSNETNKTELELYIQQKQVKPSSLDHLTSSDLEIESAVTDDDFLQILLDDEPEQEHGRFKECSAGVAQASSITPTLDLDNTCIRLGMFSENIVLAFAAVTNYHEKTPVLVCLTKTKCKEVPEEFEGFRVLQKPFYPSSKESLEAENSVSISFREKNYNRLLKKIRHINETIACHADKLFQKHTNLEAVRLSVVRATRLGFRKRPCIVLVCRCKSYIPIGESEFPTELRHPRQNFTFKTDVREGYFILGTNGNVRTRYANEWNKEMAMGCSIGAENDGCSASLGPFVTIKETNETCFLTVRHVFQPLDKPSEQIVGTNVVQPADGDLSRQIQMPNRRCGTVKVAEMNERIDAALVSICPERIPSRGNFVDVKFDDLDSAGFTLHKYPIYDDGSTQDATRFTANDFLYDRIIKFGKESGLRKGTLRISNMGVKVYSGVGSIKNGSRAQSRILKGQLQVDSHSGKTFCQEGDSGSAVFHVEYVQNENKLHCIGMVIGIMSDLTCVVTPIQPILKGLGTKINKTLELKSFVHEDMEV